MPAASDTSDQRFDGDEAFSVTSHADATGLHTVTVIGEIDAATAPHLRRFLAEVLDVGPRAVVVDMARTTFIDSAGLGVLVRALKQAEDQGADRLVLRGLQPQVSRVLEIAGLSPLFAARP